MRKEIRADDVEMEMAEERCKTKRDEAQHAVYQSDAKTEHPQPGGPPQNPGTEPS